VLERLLDEDDVAGIVLDEQDVDRRGLVEGHQFSGCEGRVK
jgi:hypothetical protein